MIIFKPEDVRPWVDEVRAHADSAKRSLGFLPARVYEDAAEQGRLLVLLIGPSDAPRYGGHLLFGGVYQNGRIFQLYVEPTLRRKGSAKLLVQEIVSQAEKVNYLSLAAHVATDLDDANRFWQHMGFETLRTRPGGKTTARTINVRVRNLNTPTLFDFVERESVHVRKRDLMLLDRLPTRVPLYLIDLNVLLDLVKTTPGKETVSKLFSAALANRVRLAVTA